MSKLNLMLWKDIRMIKNNKLQLSMSIVLVFILGLIGVFLRARIDIYPYGATFYSPVNLKTAFSRLAKIIERRRRIIEKNNPSLIPYHSVYCPQMIIGIADGNAEHFKKVSAAIAQDTEEFKMKVLHISSCDKVKENMAKYHYFCGVCFKRGIEPNDLFYDIVVAAELRDYNITFISNNWLSGSNIQFSRNPQDKFFFGTDGGPGAIREGIAFIQNIIALSHMRSHRQDYQYNNIKVERFPNTEFQYDVLLKEDCVPITSVILLGYLFPSVFVVTMIVNEKDSGVRNFLTVKGMHVPIQLLAWCIILWFITAFCSLIITILFKIGWNNGVAIMEHTSGMFLFFFLLSYCFANAAFCAMMSAVCTSNKKAIPLLTSFWLLSFIIYMHNKYNNPFADILDIRFLLMHNALTANLIHHVFKVETLQRGHDFWQLLNFGKESVAFYLLLVSGFIFFFLAWGLDYLNPGLYGKKLNFFKYCNKKKRNVGTDWFYNHIVRSTATSGQSTVSDNSAKLFLNSVSTELVVDVKDLSKSFGTEVVLEDFNLGLNAGEITVCVGQNGSGKSILAKILAGLESFDSGSIKINDIDIEKYKQIAMEDVGVALGRKLLFPDLTFMEQLIFYCRLNHISPFHSFNYVQNLMAEVDMEKYSQMMTGNLPFIIKSRLAIMCATIGRNSFVILDSVDSAFEGTAGEQLCRMLVDKKRKITFFITSCSTTIAEKLSHRVIFISGGHIVCNGSAEYLKDTFGRPTLLTSFKSKHFNSEEFGKIITNAVPEAVDEGSVMCPHVSYTMPEDSNSKLPELLRDLEKNRKNLGLDNFYVRQPKLDDFFRSIVEQRMSSISTTYDSERRTWKFSSTSTDLYKETLSKFMSKVEYMKVLQTAPLKSRFKLFWLRVTAILRKQLYSHTVDKYAFAFYILIPIILCCYAAILYRIYLEKLILKPKIFDITEYPSAMSLVSSSKRLNSESRDIISYFRSDIMRLPKKKYTFVDLMQENFVEWASDKNYDCYVKNLLTGMHVGRHAITARFNSEVLHTDLTALGQVHTAILRAILRSHEPKIQVTLVPLEPISKIYRIEFSVVRFLSFCYSLGLWFVFGLSSWGMTFDRNCFFSDQHTKHLHGSPFWLGIIISIFIKLLIVLPLALLFLCATDYRILLSKNIVLVFIIISTLGAIYFQFVKIIFLILFHEIEKKYMITIFMTILSIVVYNFAAFSYQNKLELEILLIFLPLNIIARFLFFSFYVEIVDKMCENDDVYYLSSLVEKCRITPDCCVGSTDWRTLEIKMHYLILAVFVSILLSLILSKVYRLSLLYTCKKIPQLKPSKWKKRRSSSDGEYVENLPQLTRSRMVEFNPRTETLETLPFFLDNVGKRVKNKDVVNNVSFIMRKGDCFCLLGPQGEDKVMLLRLMSGNIRQSYGRIFCFGERAIPKFGKSKNISIGYCLLELKSVQFYEVGKYMEVYALSVGIPKDKAKSLCRDLASYMDILKYYNTIIAKVPSSTKLRMSFVMAFIGLPEIVIIDISFDIIDYSGKDLMLQLTQWYQENGGTIVLSVPNTANGALFGTRLGIMVNGSMQAIGNLGTLCERYLNGYEVVAKILPKGLSGGRIKFSVKKLNEKANFKYCSFIEGRFNHATFKSQYNQYLSYFIPSNSANIAEIFETLEEQKSNLSISEYHITPNTLNFVIDHIIENCTPKVKYDFKANRQSSSRGQSK